MDMFHPDDVETSVEAEVSYSDNTKIYWSLKGRLGQHEFKLVWYICSLGPVTYWNNKYEEIYNDFLHGLVEMKAEVTKSEIRCSYLGEYKTKKLFGGGGEALTG